MLVSLCCSFSAFTFFLIGRSSAHEFVFKWNFIALKELILFGLCIRKWLFVVGHMVSAGQGLWRLMALISAVSVLLNGIMLFAVISQRHI